MSDCCEKYADFIAICSFLNVFTPQMEKQGENKIPTLCCLKNWLEGTEIGRPTREFCFFTICSLIKPFFVGKSVNRGNLLYDFLFLLLSNLKIGGAKCSNISEVDPFLISFTRAQGMGKQCILLRDYGFENILLQEKLAIIRRLLEAQLDQNKNVMQSIAYAKGSDIRHEPLGRDTAGNFYWHFVEGRSSYVIKELIDAQSEPFSQVIRNQVAVNTLLHHIKKNKAWKDDQKSSTKTAGKLKLKCGACKKSFKGNQIRDEAMWFDNPDWFCPNCEQLKLIQNITDTFVAEE